MFLNKYKKQLKSIMLILLSFMIFLPSCSDSGSPNMNSIEEKSEISESDFDIGLDEEKNGKSETLRVYWQSRNSYNPLNTFDYSGRAAQQLMHRSLLELNSSNVLSTDLAKSAQYISERNLYEIEIIQGVTFSNSKLIKAIDCRASILAYREYLESFLNPNIEKIENSESDEVNTVSDENLGEETLSDTFLADDSEMIKKEFLEKELERLNLIQEIEVINDYTLYLHLDPIKTDAISRIDSQNNEEVTASTKTLDPGVLFALTMPILPAEFVDSDELCQITSGRYTLDKVQGNITSLKALDQNFSIQNIELISYTNAAKAVRDLAENKLDLIYLTEDNFNIYGKQSNKNIVSFPGQRFYFLSFGQGDSISKPQTKSLIEKIWHVRDDLAQIITEDQSVSKVTLQYNDMAISDFNLFETQTKDTIDQSIIQSYADKKLDLELIVPEQSKEGEWALALREKMLEMNINLKIERISPENYRETLAIGDYDLAFNWLDIPYPMSITETYQAINPNFTLAESEIDIVNQLHNYFYSINRQMDQKLLDENLSLYHDYIMSNYSELDILSIRFEQAGILLSHKIDGMPNSYISQPYNSLENLWVWQ